MKSNQAYLSYILVGAAALFAGNVRAGLLYEPDSYVAQDNIVVNLDGIRNAGLLKAHDNNAEEWKNIGRAANDATFTFKEGDTSGWVADGFHFAGGAHGRLKGTQNLGNSMTVQVVAEMQGRLGQHLLLRQEHWSCPFQV